MLVKRYTKFVIFIFVFISLYFVYIFFVVHALFGILVIVPVNDLYLLHFSSYLMVNFVLVKFTFKANCSLVS